MRVVRDVPASRRARILPERSSHEGESAERSWSSMARSESRPARQDAHPDRWASNEARSSSSRSRWWYASRFAHGLSMDRPLRLRGRRQNPPERLAKGRSGAVKMDPGRAAGTAEDLSDLL